MIRLLAPLSGCLSIIVVQPSAQPLPTLNRSTAAAVSLPHNQPVAQSLVVPLAMVMLNKFVDGLPQGAFSTPDHPLPAGFLDGPDEALRVRIPIRRARRQFYGMVVSDM
jgi:hypothetical protein